MKDNGNQELAKWDRTLRLGAEIYNNLPYRNTKMYLAVFAAMLTGNPHAFDIGTADGNFISDHTDGFGNTKNYSRDMCNISCV